MSGTETGLRAHLAGYQVGYKLPYDIHVIEPPPTAKSCDGFCRTIPNRKTARNSREIRMSNAQFDFAGPDPRYAEAWSSANPAAVASFFAEDGEVTINRHAPHREGRRPGRLGHDARRLCCPVAGVVGYQWLSTTDQRRRSVESGLI